MKHKLKYPNLTLFGISVLMAVLFSWFGVFGALFTSIGSLGYVGAFIVGLLFPATFTAPLATAALFYLGASYDPTSTIILATLGAIFGDLIIFTFVKDHTLVEIKEIRAAYKASHQSHDHYRRHEALIKLFQQKPFHALALFIGGLAILSPLPDELGVAIFASYGVHLKRFIPLSAALNGAGIAVIVLLGTGS